MQPQPTVVDEAADSDSTDLLLTYGKDDNQLMMMTLGEPAKC